jgi:hypothetical protein
MNNLFNPDWWLQRACRGFAAIMCILVVRELVARSPFGSLLLLCLAIYAAYRIWAASPQHPRRKERNAGGAERTPVLPGGHRR